ncbi:MAG: glycosyltransferase [Pseudomonadota bacterium]
MLRVFPVIPALNAAAHLPATINALGEGLRTGLIGDWTLADGGSSDASVSIARRAGFRIVTGATGRGGQLAAGAEAASCAMQAGDAFLFLHADTILEPGWTGCVRRHLEISAHADRAAAFSFALDDNSAAARRLERSVNWRARVLKLPYGDQGLLITKAFHDRLGGFKPWPLFEDVDLVRRIGRRRLDILPARAVTSAERFRREGYLKRSAKNMSLLTRYYLGADPASLARAYRAR